jgi:hypothetical protein
MCVGVLLYKCNVMCVSHTKLSMRVQRQAQIQDDFMDNSNEFAMNSR